jgi:hypothetical protein
MSSKIYIANENGDWWEYTPGEKLYVLDLNDPPEDLPNWFGGELIGDEEVDENMIWNFGTEIPTPTKE